MRRNNVGQGQEQTKIAFIHIMISEVPEIYSTQA